MTLTSSDLITIIACAVTIFFGLPALLTYIPQIKESRRLRRERYSQILRGKNWNNLGIIHGFPEPSLDIRINSIDSAGSLEGQIINCQSQVIDLDKTTFRIIGNLTHNGTASITLCTEIGSHLVPVGVAKLQYREKDATLDFFYLHDHKSNPTLSWELSLPRFTTYGLVGC
ncbi:hypothetical protein AAAZ16_18350 [Klebsiella aerogenes]|uniref:hypothetical protein n=1 Tax=Klebsiella aerogenes TaxID=548 RepID=UPI0032C1A7DC